MAVFRSGLYKELQYVREFDGTFEVPHRFVCTYRMAQKKSGTYVCYVIYMCVPLFLHHHVAH